ncbi:hypothetical protein F0562_026907 [Nyssa sinensis]|uniref:Protein kinase domain-containing protein n=1 Tax=Nyssa sinensis TaxID=561372 RepID=A0A5J5B585_9ASTE|nr:hypothetical protein F0562_026907 [Nyssa sinensis]
MGNCWPAPVNNHTPTNTNTSTNTKPSSPARPVDNNAEKSKNMSSSAGSGGTSPGRASERANYNSKLEDVYVCIIEVRHQELQTRYSVGAQGLKEWQSEVKFLGKFSHPNLVRLLGYCWEDKEFLLVYEYMQKGSLENHLFSKGAEPLPWDIRLKIALGAAQGLAFLHTTEKTDFNAKLSDFGLAKLGPSNGDSHVTTRIVGTYGYAAPEYMATGHLYVKSDVYGFGVVLLEIITGLRVLDLNRPTGEHDLVAWTRPYLAERRKFTKIMDPKLDKQYPSGAAFEAAGLILKCLEPDPKNRPSMEEVLQNLEQINAIKMKPKQSKANSRNPTPQRREQPSNNHHFNNHRSPLPHKHVGFEAKAGSGARAHQHSPLTRPH